MDEVTKKLFANFQILGPFGCQGWVVGYTSKCEKSKNHCTLVYTLAVQGGLLWGHNS
jgi:hypothetical protein